MKKIMRICRENDFNQRTFYRWLVQEDYLKKEENGYVMGKKGRKV